jgi:hypothetical protein
MQPASAFAGMTTRGKPKGMTPIEIKKVNMIISLIKNFFVSLKTSLSGSNSKNQKNKRKEIWSGELKRDTDLSLICSYHKEKCKNGNSVYVDDVTWSDLNMDEIFRNIDRSTSSIGSQYLYHLLHRYEADQERLDARYNRYHLFLKDKGLREEIQKPLFRLYRDRAFYIVGLLFSELPRRPWYYFLIIASSILLLCSVIATIIHGAFIFAAIFFAIINLLVHTLYTPRISGFIPDMSNLSNMLGIVEKFSKIDDHNQIPELQSLRRHRQSANKLNKKISWLIIDRLSLGDLVASAIDYLNYFFLMDLIIFLLSINEIKRLQKPLIDIYENIGSLDSSIAVASYLNSISQYCKPSFNFKNTIKVNSIFHPLLETPVSNSFSLEDKSCLITGSNMAGKTTFIKTIGVNVILARSLNICLAESADLPKAYVRASIKRQDDLNDNKSYYYKEIEAILEFIKLSENGDSYIFLIDEIFRGTNTVERLSSATAVLSYISRKNLNMVTTHDMELQDLLNGKFGMYHFMEQIENEVHFFDYKIKHGPCNSGNAIKLLEIKGYPKSIIQEALTIAKEISFKAHKQA